MRSAKHLAVAAVVLTLLTPTVAALLPAPATPEAVRTDNLFRIINGIALVIGTIVLVLLVYFLVKFHRNKNVPRGEGHRGHTKAEIAWTFAPVVILVFIAYLSVEVMQVQETVPDDRVDEAIPINVYAQQFSWSFEYPDGTVQPNVLRIEEGRTAILNVTSKDVGHAFRVPNFGMMVDAWPNRENEVWFTAPAYKRGANVTDYFGTHSPNSYYIQCQEYCGSAHAYMTARIEVFERGSQERPFGPAVVVKSCEAPLPEGAEVQEVVLAEDGGSGAQPWSIDPGQMTLPAGATIRFQASIRGGGLHNFAIPDLDIKTADFQPPSEECVDATLPAQPGTYEYVCAIPGHAGLGMRGQLTLQ